MRSPCGDFRESVRGTQGVSGGTFQPEKVPSWELWKRQDQPHLCIYSCGITGVMWMSRCNNYPVFKGCDTRMTIQWSEHRPNFLGERHFEWLLWDGRSGGWMIAGELYQIEVLGWIDLCVDFQDENFIRRSEVGVGTSRRRRRLGGDATGASTNHLHKSVYIYSYIYIYIYILYIYNCVLQIRRGWLFSINGHECEFERMQTRLKDARRWSGGEIELWTKCL